MHTSLPEFKLKMQGAVVKESPNKKLEIKGLENLNAAKMQSLRTGRIEHAVEELAALKEVDKVEVVVMPRVPETMHTVIVKGYTKDKTPVKAILEVINIIHPTEEVELEGFSQVDDRRPRIGGH
jgi:ABC-type amino acid transport substrate-binding protein